MIGNEEVGSRSSRACRPWQKEYAFVLTAMGSIQRGFSKIPEHFEKSQLAGMESELEGKD